MKATVIALYLPQFHPTPENDEWWGKGYTEWINVGKAKPLFKGHEQPVVPGELGYYDLRIPEVREQQAQLAREAGVSAFCYWHYWLGGGKQLLEKPLQWVVECGKPDFPFCLGWANHSWYRKEWNPDLKELQNTLLVEQTYPGVEDIVLHFNTMLPAFKDRRYFKIDGRNVFYIFDIRKIPDMELFKTTWDKLALENGLKPFYFISCASGVKELSHPNHRFCDAVNVTFLMEVFGGRRSIMVYLKEKVGRWLNVALLKKSYKSVIPLMADPVLKQDRIFPTIIPNWDNSPRRKGGASIFYKSTPKLWGEHCRMIFDIIADKKEEDRVVFLKSWNEWAEGNYLEPDLKWGKQYIEELRRQLEEQ